MKINCVQEELSRGVSIVEKSLYMRSTLPMVNNLLIKTDSDGIVLAGNDLEISVEVTLPTMVQEQGEVLAPIKLLSGIVNKLPAGSVELEVDDRHFMRLVSGQSKINIHGYSTEEFPVPKRIDIGDRIQVGSEVLKDVIKKVIIAVSNEESKQVLTGVLFDLKADNKLTMVATDGYRLAMNSTSVDNSNNIDKSVIIPGRALSELNRILHQESYKGQIEITITDEQIAFSFGKIYFVSRLIQGKYIDYSQIIPKEWKTKVEIDRLTLLEALERAFVIASSSANIIKIEILDSDNKILITATNNELGDASDTLEVVVQGEKQKTIAFNVRLLMDVLKNLENDKIIVKLTGDTNPAVITENSEDDEYLYVLMPLKAVD